MGVGGGRGQQKTAPASAHTDETCIKKETTQEMAFLDILNIPGLLGTELHTFKRANVYDKLDLGLAGVVALLAGVVLLLNGFATPLACVPAACNGDSGNANPNCALDYKYQSGLCRAEVLSAPDAGFHYLLVVLALSLIGLLTVPIYWGAPAAGGAAPAAAAEAPKKEEKKEESEEED